MQIKTPIRMLADMRTVAEQRNEAVEAASKAHDWSADEWSAASRVWSRQTGALLSAILAEPAQTLDDVLCVLSSLAEHRDALDSNATETAIRGCAEATDVAIQNCIVALAATIIPQWEPTELDHQSIDWSAKRVAQWLPKPAAEWSRLVAAYRHAKEHEDAADAAGNDAEAEKQQSLRHDAEDALMAMPSPDAAGFALKVLIARGDGRDANGWDDLLTEEARQFGAEGPQS